METVRQPVCCGRLVLCVRLARATITATDARARHRTATRARLMADRRRRTGDRLLPIAEDHRIACHLIAADRLPTVKGRHLIARQPRLTMVAVTAVEGIAAAVIAAVVGVPITGVVAEAPTAEVAAGMPPPAEDMADIGKNS